MPSDVKLNPCPFCGGTATMHDGYYSEDSRADRPWLVKCDRCGYTVSKAPEYGDSNYWWLHTNEGVRHMREVIADAWNDAPSPLSGLQSEGGGRVISNEKKHQVAQKVRMLAVTDGRKKGLAAGAVTWRKL